MAGEKKNPPPKKPDTRHDRREETLVKDRTSVPRRHKVVLHNDDFTPMDFVTQILETIFHKSHAEATRIMLTVHNSGFGIAGVYSREIAETKAMQSIQAARQYGFPLLVTTEPE